MSARQSPPGEIVIVANRLPVVRADDGSWEVSPGGLVSALAPIVQAGHGSWVGWAGIPGPPPKAFDHGGMRLTPIGLNAREIEGFYEGFANAHAVAAVPRRRRAARVPPRVVADATSRSTSASPTLPRRSRRQDATVWVHDYQLQLVPAMLRALRPDLRIGFFLHIPFPPQELFMQLPWRQQILEGCSAPTSSASSGRSRRRTSLRLARRLLDARRRGTTIPYEGRTVKVGAFPVSIDSPSSRSIAARPESRRRPRAEIRAALGNPKTILLGVDRLDYTKGIDAAPAGVPRAAARSGVAHARRDACSCRWRRRAASA